MEYIGVHLTAAATTTITDRACVLHTISVNVLSTDYISLFHTLAGSVAQAATDYILTIDPAAPAQTFTFDIVCPKGLVVTLAATEDITISYAPLHS